MRTYVSQPETTSEGPGVIVIVETSEVDKYIQEVTDKLAREDHVPVAPVLYHRLDFNSLFSYTGEDADVRTRAMGGLKIYPGADHGFYGDERPSIRLTRREIPGGSRSVGCRRSCKLKRCGI
jgi:hypothetical protein